MSEIVGGKETKNAFLLLYLDYKQGNVSFSDMIEEIHPKNLQKNQKLDVFWRVCAGPIESLKRDGLVEQKDSYMNLTGEGRYNAKKLKESFSGRKGELFFNELGVMELQGRPSKRVFDKKFLYQMEEYVRGKDIHTNYTKITTKQSS